MLRTPGVEPERRVLVEVEAVVGHEAQRPHAVLREEVRDRVEVLRVVVDAGHERHAELHVRALLEQEGRVLRGCARCPRR